MMGATKYHEICVNTAGRIRARELPTDENYINVNITVKKKRQQQGVVRRIEAPIDKIDEPFRLIILD